MKETYRLIRILQTIIYGVLFLPSVLWKICSFQVAFFMRRRDYIVKMFESYSIYDQGNSAEVDGFPKSVEPLWILGRKYSTLYDMDEIRSNITSKLWLTYRKNFAPIGGTGPTSDAGWGCMLRCGQMVLAQALITRHLGLDWRWSEESLEPTYRRILHMFYDKKDSLYSIHQIAQMGAMEGKEVGQWFGPNTIAQVLKKLSIYDKWSSMVLHVALDNAVVTDDIVHLCTRKLKKKEESPQSSPRNMNASTDSNGFAIPEMKSEESKDIEPSGFSSEDQPCANSSLSGASKATNPVINDIGEDKSSDELQWKPLLLFIPLRLGLSEINPVYVNSLKNCFKLKQCVGMIGGKPNHALYFIGFVGDELIYLDPHTTQPTATCFSNECEKHSLKIDETYHCKMSSRMKVINVDPSLAICFYCESESDFRDLCSHVRKFLIDHEVQPLFELCKERPPHWPPLSHQNSYDSDLGVEEVICDTSDEDFVLLG